MSVLTGHKVVRYYCPDCDHRIISPAAPFNTHGASIGEDAKILIQPAFHFIQFLAEYGVGTA
jgi:hypothetical protein